MKKVESIKPFDSKISFKLLIKKILCFLSASLFLTTYGCTPKKVDASSAPAADAKKVTQVVSNETGTIANPVETSPTPTADVTPVDASLITPEVSATPIINNYFLFLPTEEEEKRLEIVAQEYFKRLEGNKSSELSFRYSSLPPLNIVKNLCGCFDNIGESNQVVSKEEGLFCIHNFINSYTVTVGFGINEIFNSTPDNVYFNNPESYKIFETGGFENYPGIDTLNLVESIVNDINNSIKKKDNDLVRKNSTILLTITEMIFINNGGNYNKLEITAFKDMYPIIKLFIKEEIVNALWSAATLLQDVTIKANNSSKYNLYELAEIISKDEMATLIDNEILALMDAYIEAVKSGKIVITEDNNDEATLTYSPSPTPNN